MACNSQNGNAAASVRARTVGVVLAGGAGRRMGAPKAALTDASGTTLAQRAVTALAPLAGRVWLTLAPGADTAAVCAPAAGYDVFLRHDTQPHRGPLAALATMAPDLADAALVLVLAVDMPGVTTSHLATIAHALHQTGADAAVPRRSAESPPQPLAAAYNATAIAALAAAHAQGEHSWRRALEAAPLGVCWLDAVHLHLAADAWDTVFAGVNTPQEWQAWQRTNLRL